VIHEIIPGDYNYTGDRVNTAKYLPLVDHMKLSKLVVIRNGITNRLIDEMIETIIVIHL
jgi:hypothetical protein